jgi:hypothetical protein
MGCVERHLWRKNAFINFDSGLSSKKPFDGRRRV